MVRRADLPGWRREGKLDKLNALRVRLDSATEIVAINRWTRLRQLSAACMPGFKR